MKEYIDKHGLINSLEKRIRTRRSTMEIIRDIIPLVKCQPTFTEKEIQGIMKQYWKKQGMKEFAEKLKEKFRDFKEWETEDGYPMHTMSETQRIYKCINFVDELLNEMGCCDE